MAANGPQGCCTNCGCENLTPIGEMSRASIRHQPSPGWGGLPVVDPARC